MPERPIKRGAFAEDFLKKTHGFSEKASGKITERYQERLQQGLRDAITRIDLRFARNSIRIAREQINSSMNNGGIAAASAEAEKHVKEMQGLAENGKVNPAIAKEFGKAVNDYLKFLQKK